MVSAHTHTHTVVMVRLYPSPWDLKSQGVNIARRIGAGSSYQVPSHWVSYTASPQLLCILIYLYNICGKGAITCRKWAHGDLGLGQDK